MRRFAAVFKRDKSDSHQPSSSRSHPSSTQSLKKHLKLPLTFNFTSSPPARTPSSITSTPQLSSVSEHGQSSGSSSGSASLSLPTPEEDSQATSLTRSATRRSWKDWLGRSRSEPAKVPKVSPPADWESPIPVWNERPPTLQDPRAGGRAVREVNDTDEGSSSEFDEEGSISLSEHLRPAAMGPPSPAKARQNLELLIKNSLTPTLSSSPFAQHPATYIFPRSCNRPRGLSPTLDIRRSTLNQQLLRRLEALPLDDGMELLPFASMHVPVSTRLPTLSGHNAIRPPKTTQIFPASPGLRRWISRPCFEDRFAVLLPSKDGVYRSPVIGTLAVAALEYSEFLDVMVDPDFDISSPPPDILEDVPWAPVFDQVSFQIPPLSAASDDPLSSPSSLTPRHAHISLPSPLRNQHNLEMPARQPTLQTAPPASTSPLPSPISPLSSQSSASSPPSPAIPSPAPSLPQSPTSVPVKRVVRFVEDDNDDTVPLHILRQKKKREEKAKFLRTEQRQRLMEQEQERRRLEAEEIEKERRRLVIERERKETERRLYAEEVVAARLRRESQRAGTVPGVRSDTSNLLTTSPSTLSLRETQRNRPRELGRYSLMPHHTGSSSSIPRREASEPALQSPSHSYPHEASSYRTNNGGHSPAGSNSGHGHPSRPGSMYSTSSEDGRPSSKRYSAVASISSNTARPFTERPPSSVWSNSNQSLLTSQPIPPVPPIPEFVNDLMLLPPSAPFMMHQYPRQSRRSSPGPSNSSGSLRGNSASSSSERVNMQRHSPRPTETYSAPPSPGTSPSRTESRPSHSRHGSGDSRRSSMPMSPQSYISRSQPNSLSRGRPQMPHSHVTVGPQYLHPLSPWTALLTQHGSVPIAMPVSASSHSMGLNMPARDPSSRESMRGRGGAKRQTIS